MLNFEGEQFDQIECDHSVTFSKLIIDAVDKYFKKATHDIEPLTFVLPDSMILNVKTELIENYMQFNDGFETIHFNENIFNQSAIKIKKLIGKKASDSLAKISFKLKILSKTKFNEIVNYNHYNMIYYFDSEIMHKLNTSSFLKIDELNTKQIHNLLTN